MPYIITTTTPEPILPPPAGERDDGGPDIIRRAVASLETDVSDTFLLVRYGDRNYEFPKHGGTLTLPDGTTITVERVAWWELWHEVRPDPPADAPLWSESQLIDAFNEARR